MPEHDAHGTIHWHRDADGIVTLTLDAARLPAAVADAAFADALGAVTDRLTAEVATVRGIVITSAGDASAGGAPAELLAAGPEDARRVFDLARRVTRDLRRIETLGRPVVAALNAGATGLALELALACHHRIAVDDPAGRIGLPAPALGLMPGAGGVARTVRLLGVRAALETVLLDGRAHRPARALALGLVHELAADPDEMTNRARAWLNGAPDPRQPWDAPGYRIPGGTPGDRALAARLPYWPALLSARTGGAPAPALRAVLAAAVEGAQVDFDTAQTIESRHFTEVATGQVARNMIRASLDLRATGRRSARPADVPERPVRRVAVVGAGTTGAGIAGLAAAAGLDVVLTDVTREAARRGRDTAAAVLDRAVAADRIAGDARDAALARIAAATGTGALAGCDTVIEAVPEDTDLKRAVLRDAEEAAPGALLCTGTAVLAVADLAGGLRDAARLVGLRLPPEGGLAEIVRGPATGGTALARAYDLARALERTAVVVRDAPGPFTARVAGRFIDEGLALLAEGVPAPSVERAAARAGWATPLLALLDDLSLPSVLAARAAAAHRPAGTGSGAGVLGRMIEEFGRPGRAAGAGFYGYEDGRRTDLWPGLREHFARPGVAVPPDDLRDRLMIGPVLEAVELLEVGVVGSVADANTASLLGAGFPAWTGGVLSCANGWDGGLAGFAERARRLADVHGERFAPPPALLERAAAGRPFEDAGGRTAAAAPAP
ncbi:3-hydroxyacyl-CoA dehydrogenase NAD-binding domain-containing protein [Streptomyces sp. RFCAC02]|uniref:3-hydroxyacyl-CoA dehydrogenase NAD-binding domain-containing protein n=1 Tax=Streptomyces sp. RFCAC02 TaxID=2499143 RepID=UPI00101F0559|nr:3-hydroxyacyl-CoA dehydrogenase NAD-binding domain-containing protein [Streptomyces sp. RFCAC02]